MKKQELQELQDQADELQKQLNVLTEKIANCKEEPKMFPQGGELYWYWTRIGTTCITEASDSKGRINAYRTREEAAKAVEIQWAKQRVLHRIAVLNDGWTPNWFSAVNKYLIHGSMEGLHIDSYLYKKIQPNGMYCKTRSVAEQVIKEHHDDLLLIFSE